MGTNLRQAFAELGDGLDRESGPDGGRPSTDDRIRTITRRVRRRRAARHGAQGLLVTGVAAAVAVLGVPRLVDGPSTPPPAGPGPEQPEPVPTDPATNGLPPEMSRWPVADPGQETGVCRSVLDLPDGSVHETFSLRATLDADVVAPGGVVTARVTATNDTGAPQSGYTTAGAHLLVTRDGVVVGRMGAMEDSALWYDLAPGEAWASTGRAELIGCEGDLFADEDLPWGTYEVYAMQTFAPTVEGGTPEWTDGITVVSPPVTVEVTGDGSGAQSEPQVDPTAVFPACAAEFEPGDEQVLWVDGALPEGGVAEPFELTARLGTVAEQRVIANVPTWADVVVLREGVVVGLGRTGEAEPEVREWEPGDVVELTSTYELAACAPDGTLGGPLEAGDYEARITLPVSLKEIGDRSVSDTIRVTSDPLPFAVP